MMVMTLPWHWLGLQGQWRRVANFNYADPIIAGWGPWVIVSLGGGLVLLVSALLFVRNLAVLHRSPLPVQPRPLYALAVHPPHRVPAALNGFGLWNVLGACPDATGLWLSHCPIRDRTLAVRNGPSDALGAQRWRNHPEPSRSRSALAHLGNDRRFQHHAGRDSLGRDHHPRCPGAERWDRCVHCDLPSARNITRVARTAAGLPIARRRARCLKWFGPRACCKFSPMPNRSGDRQRHMRFALPVTVTRACR